MRHGGFVGAVRFGTWPIHLSLAGFLTICGCPDSTPCGGIVVRRHGLVFPSAGAGWLGGSQIRRPWFTIVGAVEAAACSQLLMVGPPL